MLTSFYRRKVPLTYCQNIAAFRTDGLICDIKNGPKFVLNGNEVKTLHSPNEFFSSLQVIQFYYKLFPFTDNSTIIQILQNFVNAKI